MIKEISVSTHQHTEFIEIGREVQNVVKELGVKEGICLIFAPHTTAGITINEGADPDVTRDIMMELEKAVPWRDVDYQHNEGNSAAHIKSSIIGASEMVIVEDGRIILGTWQSIYFCEFDGPRHRKVYVKIVGT